MSKFLIKKLLKKHLNENKTDDALDAMNRVGGFHNLRDIDKLALLGGSNDIGKLRQLSLSQIFKENGGTFGRYEIKVRIKDKPQQMIRHKFSQEQAGKEGYLNGYIHYDGMNPYATVRFDEFEYNPELKGGGVYPELPIFLANMYPIDYKDINSDFEKYDQRVDADRQDFEDKWKTDDEDSLFEQVLMEGEFDKLKKNKVPLTDEERDEVIKAKAVWHHGPNGSESPAVWKSKDKKGKITYVTHTNRAFNTSSTLKGCIKKFHDFIKGTA